jgi:CBS domain containing-hemolysin-like protein
VLGLDLTEEEGAEDIDTIGGFIVTLAGRVPSRSEVIEGPWGLEFEVLDADPRRVKRLRVHRRTFAPETEAGEGQANAPRPESAAAE